MALIKTEDEIKKMRAAGRLAARTLKATGQLVEPGISTEDLDDFAGRFIKKNNARSAALNYHSFPKSICTSINDVVCHGIPRKEDVLQEGDIINIDVTVILSGYHGDTSSMFFVGKVDAKVKDLVERTNEALWQGLSIIDSSKCINDIGAKIEKFIQPFNYGVVRNYTGHGIGVNFHEEPSVPHFNQDKIRDSIYAGMTFTVEPMINQGSYQVFLDKDDGWTVRTKDGSLSAQFEHTCLVTENGCEILTII